MKSVLTSNLCISYRFHLDSDPETYICLCYISVMWPKALLGPETLNRNQQCKFHACISSLFMVVHCISWNMLHECSPCQYITFLIHMK
jgi:hypothetical protein